MIPKIIHYCWFGRNPLPESALKCIASWRKFFPDYEIKEWNEDNFDVDAIPYTSQAYKAGKYAFVSDYARYKILYDHGGLYFDTDVEVIRSMDHIVAAGPFMGFETPCEEKIGWVNPGLGLGAEPNMPFYRQILEHYASCHFLVNGAPNTMTVGEHTTGLLISAGLRNENTIQKVSGILIYPTDYFNPLDDSTGRLRKTENTVSIHWYTKTWIEGNNILRTKISRLYHRIFGRKIYQKINSFIRWKK